MNKVLKFGLLGFLVVLLALVRFFEHDLFSDPLLEFYHSEFSYSDPPQFKVLQVIATTSWRFFINTIISLAIIWVAFPSRKTLLFCIGFYAFAFVVLLSTFWFYITDMQADNYLIVFYIRRFLIQPIFVLILLPAFYYQQYVVKDKK